MAADARDVLTDLSPNWHNINCPPPARRLENSQLYDPASFKSHHNLTSTFSASQTDFISRCPCGPQLPH